MKNFAILCALLCFASPQAGAAKLHVVATIPELVDITARVGGDFVEVRLLKRT